MNGNAVSTTLVNTTSKENTKERKRKTITDALERKPLSEGEAHELRVKKSSRKEEVSKEQELDLSVFNCLKVYGISKFHDKREAEELMRPKNMNAQTYFNKVIGRNWYNLDERDIEHRVIETERRNYTLRRIVAMKLLKTLGLFEKNSSHSDEEMKRICIENLPKFYNDHGDMIKAINWDKEIGPPVFNEKSQMLTDVKPWLNGVLCVAGLQIDKSTFASARKQARRWSSNFWIRFKYLKNLEPKTTEQEVMFIPECNLWTS